jgi:hypothetical protein
MKTLRSPAELSLTRRAIPKDLSGGFRTTAKKLVRAIIPSIKSDSNLPENEIMRYSNKL